MFSNLKTRQLHQILKCGWVLLLLILLSGCSRNKDLPRPAKVKQIQFKENTIKVGVGKSTALQVLHTPAELNAPMYEWFVLNPDVAKVENGMLHGLSVGETVLAVTAKGSDLTARIRISVIPVQVERIILSVTDLPLVVGQEYKAEAVVLPGEASDKSLKWNSSNVSVASVGPHGQVVAKGKGTAIIWAISISNPRVQTAFQVVVSSPEDLIFTQVTASSQVSIDGYVSANLSALFENGYSIPVKLISFEVMSHSGEVVLGNYLAPVVSPSMQYRHTCTIKNIYRPYIRYIFELNGRRYERRVEIL